MDAWARTPDGSSFKDIRTLLSTAHEVDWKHSGWEPLTLSQLMVKEGEIKRKFRKAITIFHPDKHQEADAEVQFRTERIFEAVNAAYKQMSQNDSSGGGAATPAS
eukprot:NODE_13055_length_1188_cov_2.820924.p1 GENE.NODE_13055_length_1188_cov_2.820924~~NODE_13055_length_1188_cov_2.820924.p1  ORF type:complete len:105 (-),score=18.23 NODE_13055_length_1188_cov_2.820924:167-481(-)